MEMDPRYRLNDVSTLLSPSMLVYRPLVRENVTTMLAMAREADRLRPHVKTHKMAAVVRLMEEMCIRKHKVSTIAEAEMVASAGGRDVLLAHQLVGPNLGRLAKLVLAFPETTFRTIVDDPATTRALSEAMAETGRSLPVLIDLEVGMGRSGIAPGDDAANLYALIDRLPHLEPDGLHLYDGHQRIKDLEARRAAVRVGYEQTLALRELLLAQGLPVPRLVLGGTPTFPIHASWEEPGIECSPGTCTFHDMSYSTLFPDLPFVPAVALLTRVISRPRPGRICLDLGHKAVAADPSGDRLTLLGVSEAKFATHSEEHLVVETPQAETLPVGTPLLAIPTHVCPTSALHKFAYVIEDGEVVDRWEVTARDRMLTI
ncbi:D-TA family PLP-dependent enzyme [soil metagenome]